MSSPASVPSRIRVVSGSGRYTDSWHPFAETSAAIAEVLGTAGHQVEVVESEPSALAELTGVDLVVVNAGGNPEVELAPDPDWKRAFEVFEGWIDSGGPVLGVHTASNAFPDWPRWYDLLGGQWVRGTSTHPPRGEAHWQIVDPEHPATGGLTDIAAHDERYAFLTVADHATALVRHTSPELTPAEHVSGWASGAASVVYDSFGHDARSYESEQRRALLIAEVAWLLRTTD